MLSGLHLSASAAKAMSSSSVFFKHGVTQWSESWTPSDDTMVRPRRLHRWPRLGKSRSPSTMESRCRKSQTTACEKRCTRTNSRRNSRLWDRQWTSKWQDDHRLESQRRRTSRLQNPGEWIAGSLRWDLVSIWRGKQHVPQKVQERSLDRYRLRRGKWKWTWRQRWWSSIRECSCSRQCGGQFQQRAPTRCVMEWHWAVHGMDAWAGKSACEKGLQCQNLQWWRISRICPNEVGKSLSQSVGSTKRLPIYMGRVAAKSLESVRRGGHFRKPWRRLGHVCGILPTPTKPGRSNDASWSGWWLRDSFSTTALKLRRGVKFM